MNIRKLLLNIISPSPLPESKDYRRTLMWRDCLGQFPVRDDLIQLTLRVADRARTISLPILDERLGRAGIHNTWPGEHYRLLAAFVDLLKPSTVVEFGTYSGASCLAMLGAMAPGGRIATFDLLPWRQFPHSPLRETDFAGAGLVQHLDNLADLEAAHKHRDLIESADLFFIDGPKDGRTEPRLFENLHRLNLRRGSIFVIDDIHNRKLIPTWDTLPHPRFDITSFGHWTGTGLMSWECISR